MSRPPRPRGQPLLDRGLLLRAFWLGSIEAALCFAGFLLVFIMAGHTHRIGLAFLEPVGAWLPVRLSIPFEMTLPLAATVYHAGVVMAQVGNALACRSDRTRGIRLGWLSNRYLWFGIILELLGIVSLVHIPALAHLFNHVPLPGWIWAGLAMYAPVLYSIEWIRKAIVRGSKSTRNGRRSTLSLQEVAE